MAHWSTTVPLTQFQGELLAELAASPDDDRYLAGGAALHFQPNSARFSDDLDFFSDSEARVASAYTHDRASLEKAGYDLSVEISLPGFVRALVHRGKDETRIDWAHDSAWRFMPLVRDELGGLLLHPVDLAINKVLALAGRDEPRDFVDILFVHEQVLPLPALCWAAVGKDPGLSPLFLIELLKRRGRYQPGDFDRLQLAAPFDLQAARSTWLEAIEAAEAFVRARPPDEVGCLYYSTTARDFVVPKADSPLIEQGIVVHHGAPGGVVPRFADEQIRPG